MNRRIFLSKLGATAATTGAAVTAVGASVNARAKEVAESQPAEKLRRELSAATTKLRALEKRHQRLSRVVVGVFLMSTGLDAVAWIKGDPF